LAGLILSAAATAGQDYTDDTIGTYNLE